MKKLILYSIGIFLVTSCASNERLLENGDYEKLISRVTKKLAGKKKSTDDVLALEAGYRRLKTETLGKIDNLKAANTVASWEKALSIYYSIDKIQDKISPLLPIRSETGRKAKIDLINVDSLMVDAKETVVAFYHSDLNNLKTKAYNGDKLAARDAVQVINKMHQVMGVHTMNSLKFEMTELGMNTIWMEVEDRSYSRLPYRLYDELEFLELRNTTHGWNRFVTNPGEELKPDYKVVLKIYDIVAEPSFVRSVENNYRKNVEDGWEYVFDVKGNVAKDSLGNDIKKLRYANVHATVINEILTKRAYASGHMEVIDLYNGNTIFSRSLHVEDIFTHTARNYVGDMRALDSHLTIRISPVREPNNSDMILSAIDKLKHSFIYEAKNIRYY